MIGESILIAQAIRDTSRGRGSIPGALRKSRHATNPLACWHRRATQLAVQRRRAFAFVSDQLEVRSVPSNFANFSLSALAFAVQPTNDSALLLMQNVAVPTNLEGPGALLAPGSTAPASVVEPGVVNLAGAALDAVDTLSVLVDAAPVPAIPPIDFFSGGQISGPVIAGGGAAGALPLIDVSTTISARIALPLSVPGVSNIVTDLTGPLDDALDAHEGVAAAASGGSGGAGIGISITVGSPLADLNTSVVVSNQGIALTPAGLPVDVKVSLSPVEPIGGSSVSSPPADSTASSPGNSTTPTSPATPTSPTIERSPVSNSTAPTSEAGSTAVSLPSSASPGVSASTGASDAPSTGSPAGNPAQAIGSVAGAQSGVFVATAGSAIGAGLLGGSTAHEASSSTTGLSISASVSSLSGDGIVTGQGVGGGEQNLAGSPSLNSERPTDPKIKPAELLPGDLASLERALSQLMRRFDEMGGDLGGLFGEFNVPEILFAAGMAGVAAEVCRRWERRRRLAIPRAHAGFSGRPGPFYRPKAYPFGRPGCGRLVDRPASI